MVSLVRSDDAKFILHRKKKLQGFNPLKSKRLVAIEQDLSFEQNLERKAREKKFAELKAKGRIVKRVGWNKIAVGTGSPLVYSEIKD